MAVDDRNRYIHAEQKPFEPYLSRSLKRQQKILPIAWHFTLLFLALLSLPKLLIHHVLYDTPWGARQNGGYISLSQEIIIHSTPG